MVDLWWSRSGMVLKEGGHGRGKLTSLFVGWCCFHSMMIIEKQWKIGSVSVIRNALGFEKILCVYHEVERCGSVCPWLYVFGFVLCFMANVALHYSDSTVKGPLTLGYLLAGLRETRQGCHTDLTVENSKTLEVISILCLSFFFFFSTERRWSGGLSPLALWTLNPVR